MLFLVFRCHLRGVPCAETFSGLSSPEDSCRAWFVPESFLELCSCTASHSVETLYSSHWHWYGHRPWTGKLSHETVAENVKIDSVSKCYEFSWGYIQATARLVTEPSSPWLSFKGYHVDIHWYPICSSTKTAVFKVLLRLKTLCWGREGGKTLGGPKDHCAMGIWACALPGGGGGRRDVQKGWGDLMPPLMLKIAPWSDRRLFLV